MISETVQHRPAPAVRPFVAWYTGYRDVDAPPMRHRGLPSPYLTVIVTLDDPLLVARHPDPRTPPGAYTSLVGGLHTKPAMIVHEGRSSGIQLALSPLGCRALLHLPAGELTSLDVPGEAVLGRFAAQLRERLLSVRTWPERFAVLDGALAGRLRDAVAPVPIAAAWERLLASGGTVRVGELARESGWSERWLRRLFLTEVGLTPKEAARVVRFDAARRAVQAGAGLAQTAMTAGYADQAHLTRDFTRFAGISPTGWRREECRNLQDPAARAAADSAA